MAHTAPKPHGQRSKGGLEGKRFLHIHGLNRVAPPDESPQKENVEDRSKSAVRVFSRRVHRASGAMHTRVQRLRRWRVNQHEWRSKPRADGSAGL